MMKGKRFSAMALAGVMAVSASFCSAAEVKADDEKVGIRFYNIWPKNEEDPQVVEQYKMYEEFQAENPDIELENIADAHEAWATKIKTMMAANDLPEIFISQPSDFAVYADSGVYYDFTDDLEADPEWRDSFVSGSLDILAKDGRVYGIPHTGYVEGVYYNQELFDQCGLTYPETYDDLVECVKVFVENDIVPFAVGAKDGWPVSMYTQYLMDREAGYDYFAKACEDESTTMDTPEYIRAFEKFMELAELGAFSEGASGASQQDSISLFTQGKAAMMVDGDWDMGTFLQADNGEFGKKVRFANFPSIPDGKGVQDALCVGFGKSFCISNSASDEQKEAALRFIKYMNCTEASTRLLEEGGGQHANKIADVNEDKVSELLNCVTEYAGSTSQTWAAYGEFITPGFYDEMNKIGQKMLLNAISAEDAVKELEKARLEFQINQ